YYRPAQKGAFYLSWDASLRYAQNNPFGYQYINNVLNMPDEYRGVLVSDMETTFNAYAFLVLYRCNKYGVGCPSGAPKPSITPSTVETSLVLRSQAYSGMMYNIP